MGLLPIENELRTRSLARWAFAVQELHGALPLEQVFRSQLLERYELHGLRTSDLFGRDRLRRSQRQTVSLSELLPPHRREQLETTASRVESDLSRIEQYLEQGATLYVTPEGEYTRSGAMLPFRGIWQRIAPRTKRVYLAGISYDPFAGRRLSQLYRIVPLRRRDRVVDELKTARPITVSALIGSWLSASDEQEFSPKELAYGVESMARALPPKLFLDPEYANNPQAQLQRAIQHMRQARILAGTADRLRLTKNRRHPQFPRVDDIVAFQARFFSESFQAAMPEVKGAVIGESGIREPAAAANSST